MDMSPELRPRTRSIANSMTGVKAGLERLMAPFEPKKLQKSQETQPQGKSQREPETDSGPYFGMG